MLNAFTNVSVTKDVAQNIIDSLKDLGNKNICVGIPQEENVMHEGCDGITNAELLYIHTHGIRETSMRREMQHDLDSGMPYSRAHELYVHENGSPLWSSPPRPVLEPSINANKEIIAEEMKKTLENALEGTEVNTSLEKVGMLCQNVVRAWFTNPENKWPKNSEETIKRKGSNKPLIDTGELRKAITYVIKEGDIE